MSSIKGIIVFYILCIFCYAGGRERSCDPLASRPAMERLNMRLEELHESRRHVYVIDERLQSLERFVRHKLDGLDNLFRNFSDILQRLDDIHRSHTAVEEKVKLMDDSLDGMQELIVESINASLAAKEEKCEGSLPQHELEFGKKCWSPPTTSNHSLGIYGGRTAKELEFPYMVALDIKFNDGYSQMCGGTILSLIWILTAGHCLSMDGKTVASVSVGYNSVALNQMHTKNIAKFFVHPEYKYDAVSTAVYNDIALIKLSAPLEELPGVMPICTAGERTTFFGKVTATGWGWNAEHSTPNILQYTSLDMIDMDTCRTGFKHLVQLDKKLCTFTHDTGTWKGDSGGPIVAQVAGNHVQIGIISYGHNTRPDLYPDVYTKIASYAPWIKYITRNF